MILLLILFGYPLVAERIQIKNGDLFTGKIVRLNAEYALVTSYLGDFRISRKYIALIENTSGLPVRVVLQSGETMKLVFNNADAQVIHFLQDGKKIAIDWDKIRDCIFLEP